MDLRPVSVRFRRHQKVGVFVMVVRFGEIIIQVNLLPPEGINGGGSNISFYISFYSSGTLPVQVPALYLHCTCTDTPSKLLIFIIGTCLIPALHLYRYLYHYLSFLLSRSKAQEKHWRAARNAKKISIPTIHFNWQADQNDRNAMRFNSSSRTSNPTGRLLIVEKMAFLCVAGDAYMQREAEAFLIVGNISACALSRTELARKPADTWTVATNGLRIAFVF